MSKHVIFTDQLDMLWKRRSFYLGDKLEVIDDVISAIIVCCKACKGTGQTLTRVNVISLWKRECPVCNGHGWRIDNGR